MSKHSDFAAPRRNKSKRNRLAGRGVKGTFPLKPESPRDGDADREMYGSAPEFFGYDHSRIGNK